MSVSPEHPIKRRCDVGAGEEYRYQDGGAWWDPSDNPFGAHLKTWVEARPKQQPAPRPIASRGLNDGFALEREGPGGFTVTTVGEMRDRTDLDQWEYCDATWGRWANWPTINGFTSESDDFPVIVRRKP